MSGRKVIAFLRAVNVGGRGKVAMADLRAQAGKQGLLEAQTLLQSGNLLFVDPKDRPLPDLESLLEKAAETELGLTTDFILRTPADWAEYLDANPFPQEAAASPTTVLLMPLKALPSAGGLDRLSAAIKGPEKVDLAGQALYALYPEGVGHSKLTTALIERHLGTSGTARNWNTVTKIAALTA